MLVALLKKEIKKMTKSYYHGPKRRAEGTPSGQKGERKDLGDKLYVVAKRIIASRYDTVDQKEQDISLRESIREQMDADEYNSIMKSVRDEMLDPVTGSLVK